MAAIIKTGGKQYRVDEGDIIRVEKLKVPAGDKVVFKEVLGVSTDKGFQVGTPLVAGASVEGKVLKHDKAKKVIVFKYKAKKDYRKKQGHRQPYSQVQIEKIVLGGSKTSKAEAETAAAVKAEEKPAAKAAPAKETAKTTAAKKTTTAAKSATAKAAAEKKPAAAKSTAAKPAAEKKPAAKSTAAKATAEKKPAAKSTTAKSTAAKSTTAKATTAKKTTASAEKKPAAKKTAAKKPAEKKTDAE